MLVDFASSKGEELIKLYDSGGLYLLSIYMYIYTLYQRSLFLNLSYKNNLQ